MFEVHESDIVGVHIDEDVVLGKKPIEFIRSLSNQNSDIEGSDIDSEKNVENLESIEKSKAKTYA